MTASKGADFEKQFKRLQAIVEQLERGDLPLEKGVALYKEGLLLARTCREHLQQARHEISVFSEGMVREFPAAPESESGAGEDETEGEDDV